MSVSWMIPHRSDTCGIFMSFFLRKRKLKLSCGGDRATVVNWLLALVSPWLALYASLWLITYDLSAFLLDCKVLDIGNPGFVSLQAPPPPSSTFPCNSKAFEKLGVSGLNSKTKVFMVWTLWRFLLQLSDSLPYYTVMALMDFVVISIRASRRD